MLVGKFALSVINSFGIFVTFFIFMVIAFVGCMLFAGYGVETSGKNDR